MINFFTRNFLAVAMVYLGIFSSGCEFQSESETVNNIRTDLKKIGFERYLFWFPSENKVLKIQNVCKTDMSIDELDRDWVGMYTVSGARLSTKGDYSRSILRVSLNVDYRIIGFGSKKPSDYLTEELFTLSVPETKISLEPPHTGEHTYTVEALLTKAIHSVCLNESKRDQATIHAGTSIARQAIAEAGHSTSDNRKLQLKFRVVSIQANRTVSYQILNTKGDLLTDGLLK